MDDYRNGAQTVQAAAHGVQAAAHGVQAAAHGVQAAPYGAPAAPHGGRLATVTRDAPFLHGRWQSLRAAWAGVRYTFRTQRNAQIEAAAAVLIFGAAWFFRVSSLEWALLALTVFLIFALEAVNTAIEAAVDLVSPEVHPLARIAKDAAAGALVLASAGAILVAAILFGPRLAALFR